MGPHCWDRTVSRRVALSLGGATVTARLAPPVPGVRAGDITATLHHHRDLVQRLFEDGVNAGDEAVIVATYARMSPRATSELRAKPALVSMPISLGEFRRVAPGITATVEALVAEADLVAARVTWRGFAPPAGTYLAGQTMHLFRLESAQIVEQWAAGWEWLDDCGIRPLCAPANPLMS